MKKQILFLIGLFFFTGVSAQDAAFMNTHHSLVALNPSFAGSNGFIRNQTAYRNQWPNLSGALVTYGSSFDGYIKPIKGGVALSVMSDDQGRGTLRQTSAALTYAQYISFENGLKIIPSIQASYNQNTLDKGRLNFGDPLNVRTNQVWNTGYIPGPTWNSGTTTAMPRSSIKYADFSSGLLVYYHASYFGVSCAHITEPDISLMSDQKYRLPIRTTIHASSNFMLGQNTISNIYGAASTQGPYQLFRMRVLNTYKDKFMYGLGFCNNSQFQFIAGIRAGAFTLNYSYDLAVSKLSGNTAGSHELSMSISLKKKEEERSKSLEKR